MRDGRSGMRGVGCRMQGMGCGVEGGGWRVEGGWWGVEVEGAGGRGEGGEVHNNFHSGLELRDNATAEAKVWSLQGYLALNKHTPRRT